MKLEGCQTQFSGSSEASEKNKLCFKKPLRETVEFIESSLGRMFVIFINTPIDNFVCSNAENPVSEFICSQPANSGDRR
jgi:hypothetical protein